MSLTRVPKHVAIIMDGNGRWAEKRRHLRIFGHVRGCKRVIDIVRAADNMGVKALTLFAFSTENWSRPKEEVGLLFRLLKKWLLRQQAELMQKNIRIRSIGAIDKLPAEVKEILYSTIERSKNNTGLQLTLALSYGGREEITSIVQSVAEKVASGEMKKEEITEDFISSMMCTQELGDPDLLIRTSGEVRVSNFLLWQLAYSELYFTETMWPDFTVDEFHAAIFNYMNRERRFGKTSSQVQGASTQL